MPSKALQLISFLIFNVLCISESCIEIKIKLIFLFLHFFVVPQKILLVAKMVLK